VDVADRRLRVEKYRDLVARLHALPRRRLTLLVGVDGTGSGVASFARALAGADPGLDLVQVEDFGVPLQPGSQRPALDWRRLRSELLVPLSRDQSARYRRYDPRTGAPAEWRTVPVGGMVVVAGACTLVRALSGFYDFRIWVEGGELGPPAVEDDDVPLNYDQEPTRLAHLLVDGAGRLPHDPLLEYVRFR
jgi:hypothetical protein